MLSLLSFSCFGWSPCNPGPVLENVKAIITATASVAGNFLAPPLLEVLKLQWRLKTAMAVMLLVPLGLGFLEKLGKEEIPAPLPPP